jgi:hypothetical protein
MKLFDKILTGLGIAGAASGAMAGEKGAENPVTLNEPTAKVIQQKEGTSSMDNLDNLMKSEGLTLTMKKANIAMPGEEKSLEELEAENNAINAANKLHNEAVRASMSKKNTEYEISNARESIKKMIDQEKEGSSSESPTMLAEK